MPLGISAEKMCGHCLQLIPPADESVRGDNESARHRHKVIGSAAADLAILRCRKGLLDEPEGSDCRSLCSFGVLSRYRRSTMPDFDSECFFIAPIGDEDTEIRKRSDGVRDWVVAPAAQAAAELKTVRADDVGEPGQITAQAVQHCLKAKAAVADLTGGNPNVYYELSVRHGALLPVVLIAEEDTKLPFDLSQSRVIFFDHTDLSSAGRATEELQAQIEASLTGTPDNPISDGMRLAELQAGSVEEQTLALVMDRLQRLSHTTEEIDARLRRSEGWHGSVMRGVPTMRGVPIEPRGGTWTVVQTDPTQREYVLEDDPGDDLSPEEKAEIEAENREHESRQRPLSDGDPEAG
jgi:hypothetical protein